MSCARVGRLAETPCLTGCALKPEYSQAALAPLEGYQRDNGGQPVEYIGQHGANCMK